MNITTSNNGEFFLNKRNITHILGSVINNYGLQLNTDNKTELLQLIVNEMKIINNKIDRNKLITKNNQELTIINDNLNKMVVDNIKPKLNILDNSSKRSNVARQNNTNQKSNIIISQRPVNTNISDKNPKNNYNNRDNYLVPVPNNNTFDPRDQMNINSRYHDNDDSSDQIDKKYMNFMEERNKFMPGNNPDRPSTPDFSLDGSGKKIKKENEKRIDQPIMNAVQLQGMNGNYDLNGRQTGTENYNSGILENFTSDDPIDMMAFNSTDAYANNLNNFNTGIDPHILEQFKEKLKGHKREDILFTTHAEIRALGRGIDLEEVKEKQEVTNADSSQQ
jgi:hypothetical protein